MTDGNGPAAQAWHTEPLTPDRWEAFETVLGPGGRSGCWCMYWLTPTTREWSGGARGGATAANKPSFKAVVEAGPAPGIIAYDGVEPIGWCRVMPRDVHIGLARSRWFRTDLDTEGVWSLSCFVVRAGWRGRGVTEALAKAGVRYAVERGATVVEAYPVDLARHEAGKRETGKKDPSALWTGVASTFERLGFEVVQRRSPDRPMMRLSLRAPASKCTKSPKRP